MRTLRTSEWLARQHTHARTHMSGKKRAHETIDVDAEPKSQPGDDWRKRAKQVDLHRDDWARASNAADMVVNNAMAFVTKKEKHFDDLNADALLTQHVKAQLAYLNMCKTGSVAASVDGALINTLDGALTCFTQHAKPVKEEKVD